MYQKRTLFKRAPFVIYYFTRYYKKGIGVVAGICNYNYVEIMKLSWHVTGSCMPAITEDWRPELPIAPFTTNQ